MGLQSPSGRQAILIADSNVFARNLLIRELVEEGFFILAAANCEEAIRLSQSFEGEIELLVLNDDLPGQQALVDAIQGQRPGIRLLTIPSETHKNLVEISQQRARWVKDRSSLPGEFRKQIREALANPAGREGAY
ncbi:MAG: hypothetical protein JOZ22_14665 [Acidobacteriia bacterium]|nr:hypothetical protein [Terriglobia bacterium]